MKTYSRSGSLGFALVGFLILAASGCSKAGDNGGTDAFPQFNSPVSSACPAGYTPITLDSPTGTISSFDEAIAGGNLRYSGSETYFQITQAGTVIAQAHIVDEPGKDPLWKCSNSIPQANGYDVETNLNLPISIVKANGQYDSEIHGYAIQVSEGFPGMVLMTDTSGQHSAGSLPQLLDLQGVSNYRVYRLPDGSFELRLKRDTNLGNDGVASTTSVTRFVVGADLGAR